MIFFTFLFIQFCKKMCAPYALVFVKLIEFTNELSTWLSAATLIAQSILWAAAILVVAVAEENNFSIWLLVLLAAVSITYLSRQRF